MSPQRLGASLDVESQFKTSDKDDSGANHDDFFVQRGTGSFDVALPKGASIKSGQDANLDDSSSQKGKVSFIVLSQKRGSLQGCRSTGSVPRSHVAPAKKAAEGGSLGVTSGLSDKDIAGASRRTDDAYRAEQRCTSPVSQCVHTSPHPPYPPLEGHASDIVNSMPFHHEGPL